MGAALVPLQNITLGSAAASVIFGSIPGTMRDLVLIVNGQTTGALNNLVVRFNGDTGSNYSYVRMLGDGSSGSSASNGSLNYAAFGDVGTLDSVVTASIMDYSATDKHKSALVRGNNAGGVVSAYAVRWASTSAITSLSVAAGAGNLASGMTVALYGVKS